MDFSLFVLLHLFTLILGTFAYALQQTLNAAPKSTFKELRTIIFHFNGRIYFFSLALFTTDISKKAYEYYIYYFHMYKYVRIYTYICWYFLKKLKHCPARFPP